MAAEFPNLEVLDNALARERLAVLRDRHTDTAAFKRTIRDLGRVMAVCMAADLPERRETIETPMEEMEAPRLAAVPVLVPILRAGLGLAAGFEDILPGALFGHVGVYRDESRDPPRPVEYYKNFPALKGRPVWIIDPMLATGHSMAYAVTLARKAGADPDRIRCACVIAAPEGVRVMAEEHPQVKILTAGLDRELNALAYICPGLGDAGDRNYGTD